MAHAKEQIAADQPNDVILLGCTRNLSMSSIVTKQPKLCGNKGQIGGIEELEPQRLYRDQEDDAQCKQTQQKDHLEEIVQGLLFQ